VQSISLNFTPCELITNQGLESLSDSLERLIFLQPICNRWGRTIDESVEILSDSLQGLSWDNDIKDEGLEILSDSLQGLSWDEDITDEGLKSLSDSLQRLTSLQSIDFNFDG